LFNSLKFSDKGVIKIEIKILKTYKNQDISKSRISITIIDEGKGLNGKSMKDLIFSNLKKNADANGFGLGLFIVNDFVENLNGSFELKNNETNGCSAKVEFEFQIDDSNSANNEFKTEYKINNILNVLLIENDLTNSYTLQKILEQKGHKVSIVSKGKEVLLQLQNSNYDIVLIDVCLPDMNGIELTKLIRSGGEYSFNKNIPIIGLSAKADPQEMKECIDVGMNEYITKPINSELLLQKMNEHSSYKVQEMGSII
jgi:CheY-like chemotaxis protein